MSETTEVKTVDSKGLLQSKTSWFIVILALFATPEFRELLLTLTPDAWDPIVLKILEFIGLLGGLGGLAANSVRKTTISGLYKKG